MKQIDLIKYIIDNYDKDEEIEWCFTIYDKVVKLEYYIWCSDKFVNASCLPAEKSDDITLSFYKNIWRN